MIHGNLIQWLGSLHPKMNHFKIHIKNIKHTMLQCSWIQVHPTHSENSFPIVTLMHILKKNDSILAFYYVRDLGTHPKMNHLITSRKSIN